MPCPNALRPLLALKESDAVIIFVGHDSSALQTLKAAARKEFPILDKFNWIDGVPALQAPGLVPDC